MSKAPDIIVMLVNRIQIYFFQRSAIKVGSFNEFIATIKQESVFIKQYTDILVKEMEDKSTRITVTISYRGKTASGKKIFYQEVVFNESPVSESDAETKLEHINTERNGMLMRVNSPHIKASLEDFR